MKNFLLFVLSLLILYCLGREIYKDYTRYKNAEYLLEVWRDRMSDSSDSLDKSDDPILEF